MPISEHHGCSILYKPLRLCPFEHRLYSSVYRVLTLPYSTPYLEELCGGIILNLSKSVNYGFYPSLYLRKVDNLGGELFKARILLCATLGKEGGDLPHKVCKTAQPHQVLQTYYAGEQFKRLEKLYAILKSAGWERALKHTYQAHLVCKGKAVLYLRSGEAYLLILCALARIVGGAGCKYTLPYLNKIQFALYVCHKLPLSL